jgi:hypothetical protein
LPLHSIAGTFQQQRRVTQPSLRGQLDSHHIDQ